MSMSRVEKKKRFHTATNGNTVYNLVCMSLIPSAMSASIYTSKYSIAYDPQGTSTASLHPQGYCFMLRIIQLCFRKRFLRPINLQKKRSQSGKTSVNVPLNLNEFLRLSTMQGANSTARRYGGFQCIRFGFFTYLSIYFALGQECTCGYQTFYFRFFFKVMLHCSRTRCELLTTQQHHEHKAIGNTMPCFVQRIITPFSIFLFRNRRRPM